MELSDGLSMILKGHLGWGKCRLDCFIGMLLAAQPALALDEWLHAGFRF
jgi:hypothetical protein